LNSILLWTQMLQQHTGDPEQVIRGLTAIERNTKIQAQLISDLLDVSSITSGKLRLDVQPLDLAATIRTALEGLMPAIEAKALRLRTMFDQQAGMISGDSSRLQQVIWNLVNNASSLRPLVAKSSCELTAAIHLWKLALLTQAKALRVNCCPICSNVSGRATSPPIATMVVWASDLPLSKTWSRCTAGR
jgi:light-regulated signal transduction histidine kinase (bacteriophytochrome)